MFPCFDQPDLKATWILTALTPQDWTVISNVPSADEDMYGDQQRQGEFGEIGNIFGENVEDKLLNTKLFFFSESPKISTYLYAIVAGPYSFHQRNDEGFPHMRIYARRSVLESVNHDEMFTVTQEGIKFYE